MITRKDKTQKQMDCFTRIIKKNKYYVRCCSTTDYLHVKTFKKIQRDFFFSREKFYT